MSDRIVIIDGNSLINRAYYAMRRPMITSEGIYTQGIYGFLNMLNKILDDYSPEYIAVAWDKKAPTFRHKSYDQYKAGRKKMPPELAMEMPIMKDILEAMNISNLEIEGFEADDIIGTVSRVAEEEGLAPLIITGDKDALQLASDVTKVLITKKGISEFDLYDRDKMIERYSLTPEQFIDLKGLMGDQSDNIPGIPGVGEKTGIKLLEQFGSIANMIANTDEIKNKNLRTKVEENVPIALMSRKLAEIYRFVPLDFEINQFKMVEPDYEKLIDLYVKLEFNSFLKRLKEEHGGDVITESAEDFFDNSIEEIPIKTSEDLAEIEKIPAGSKVTIHVNSDNNHIDKPVIREISLLVENKLYNIKCDNFPETLFDLDQNQGEDVLNKLVDILNTKDFKFIGNDLVLDAYALMANGLNSFKVEFDTQVAAYVLDPSRSKYEFKTMVFEAFRVEIPEDDESNLLWCRCARKLAENQAKEIKENQLEKVLYEVELPLVEVLAAMEIEGFKVNKDILDQFGSELSKAIDELTKEIHDLAGEEFNINSPKQLGDILFEKLELPAGKKTKRGYSTSADILMKIKNEHPIVDKVLKFRSLSKLNSTYVEGLKPLIATDGKIHAHFQQTVTATGRISCTEPNLQNIPIRDEYGRQLRKSFIPSDEEHILVGADYSQIELRVLAHLSGDEGLIEAFNEGADIHRNTAARVFNLDYDEVTPLDRSRAKAVNFGVIYGMSGFGLSEELNITRKEAEGYIEDYFDKHKAVKDYMDKQLEFCKNNGYTTTILGRRRYIREINSGNFMTRQFGERLAMNSPIQGSAADIIKIAMVKVFNELRNGNYKSKLILQIHDELIIDAAKDELEEIKALLTKNMKEAMELKVSLETDLNTGDSWYTLK